MDIYQKLAELNLALPKLPNAGGKYAPIQQLDASCFYISGCGPSIDGNCICGKLGADISLEEGKLAARNCILNMLSILNSCIKDLNRIDRFVKLTVFISSSPNFYEQPKVADAATGLLAELFDSDSKLPARSAVGMVSLPGNISVEIEAVVRLKN